MNFIFYEMVFEKFPVVDKILGSEGCPTHKHSHPLGCFARVCAQGASWTSLDGAGDIPSAHLASSFCSTAQPAIPTCLSDLPSEDSFTPWEVKITPTILRTDHDPTLPRWSLSCPSLLPVSQICKASSPRPHTHTSSFSSALLICNLNLSNNHCSFQC